MGYLVVINSQLYTHIKTSHGTSGIYTLFVSCTCLFQKEFKIEKNGGEDEEGKEEGRNEKKKKGRQANGERERSRGEKGELLRLQVQEAS